MVLEEINMRQDTPMALIGDLWEKLLYGNQPAGMFTIGVKENILGFEKKHFTDYLNNHYSAENTIVCIAGKINPKQAKAKVEKAFQTINHQSPKQKAKTKEKQTSPQSLEDSVRLLQSLGFATLHKRNI